MTSEPLDLGLTIDGVISALQRNDVPYFISGSVAGSVHGEVRATNDVDIVADMSPAQLRHVVASLQSQFTVDADIAAEEFFAGRSFNAIHATTYLKVDVFPATGAFEREAIRRAIGVTLPGVAHQLSVASLEDILLAKLRWYRLGGESSGVQHRDIERLVALNKGLFDAEYLRVWSNQLSVADLLAKYLNV